MDKDHARLHSYGTIDELNSVLGVARSHRLNAGLDEMVARVQMALFYVGADLATPLNADVQSIVRVDKPMVRQLEIEIDALDEELPVLKNFIVPGGTPGAATLNFARTVCRRAERWISTLGKETELNPQVQQYVNRLSDWLFVMARVENARAGVGDVLWESPRSQSN